MGKLLGLLAGRSTREGLGEGFLSEVPSNSWIDTIIFKCSLKLVDSIVNFLICIRDFNNGYFIKLLCLLIFKLKLALFSLLLIGHVLLPVLNSLGEPLLHEAGISLELVDLSTSDFLSDPFFLFFFSGSISFGLFILADSFVIELLEMVLHVHGLLRLV